MCHYVPLCVIMCYYYYYCVCVIIKLLHLYSLPKCKYCVAGIANIILLLNAMRHVKFIQSWCSYPVQMWTSVRGTCTTVTTPPAPSVSTPPAPTPAPAGRATRETGGCARVLERSFLFMCVLFVNYSLVFLTSDQHFLKLFISNRRSCLIIYSIPIFFKFYKFMFFISWTNNFIRTGMQLYVKWKSWKFSCHCENRIQHDKKNSKYKRCLR